MTSTNLLSIKTIPIQVEIKTTNAKLQLAKQDSAPAPHASTRKTKDGLKMRTDNIQFNMDAKRETPQAPSASEISESYSSKNLKFSYQAVARTDVSEDTKGAQVDISTPPSDLDMGRFQKKIENMLEYVPTVAPEFSWDGDSLNIAFLADDMEFDFESLKFGFEFIPGKIEFIVNEQPKVIIEYMGDPIYFPANAFDDLEM